MKGYEKYIADIKSGRIKSGIYIKQAVERFCELRNRPDIYFDADVVDDCENFIFQIKHFLGKSAGQHFVLQPWQSAEPWTADRCGDGELPAGTAVKAGKGKESSVDCRPRAGSRIPWLF